MNINSRIKIHSTNDHLMDDLTGIIVGEFSPRVDKGQAWIVRLDFPQAYKSIRGDSIVMTESCLQEI